MANLTKADLAKITHTRAGHRVDGLHLHGGMIRGRYGRPSKVTPSGLIDPNRTLWESDGTHPVSARLDLDTTPLQ